MSGKRRRYTPEFRGQAARLVIETGRPVAHVVVEIGVGEQVLGRRVRLQRQAAAAGDTGAVLDADERAELERLRRENAKLRLDHEFLKKNPSPSLSPSRTGRGLPGDRRGEGQLVSGGSGLFAAHGAGVRVRSARVVPLVGGAGHGPGCGDNRCAAGLFACVPGGEGARPPVGERGVDGGAAAEVAGDDRRVAAGGLVGREAMVAPGVCPRHWRSMG
jgi:transposase